MSKMEADEIASIIRERISNFELNLDDNETGIVIIDDAMAMDFEKAVVASITSVNCRPIQPKEAFTSLSKVQHEYYSLKEDKSTYARNDGYYKRLDSKKKRWQK